MATKTMTKAEEAQLKTDILALLKTRPHSEDELWAFYLWANETRIRSMLLQCLLAGECLAEMGPDGEPLWSGG